jgi:hypothetical protein
VFWPTTCGLQLFPRLTGLLSATHAFRTHLEANGVYSDEVDHRVIDDLLETTPAGRKILGLGRMAIDIEMRAPDGRRVEFASIAFSEPAEIKRLAHELRIDAASDLPDLPPDAPRHIVSVTLRTPPGTPRHQSRDHLLRERSPRSVNPLTREVQTARPVSIFGQQQRQCDVHLASEFPMLRVDEQITGEAS